MSAQVIVGALHVGLGAAAFTFHLASVMLAASSSTLVTFERLHRHYRLDILTVAMHVGCPRGSKVGMSAWRCYLLGLLVSRSSLQVACATCLHETAVYTALDHPSLHHAEWQGSKLCQCLAYICSIKICIVSHGKSVQCYNLLAEAAVVLHLMLRHVNALAIYLMMQAVHYLASLVKHGHNRSSISL